MKYTSEKNVQILIALLKQHGINTVIASPGTTNIAFVGSIQYDDFFHIYSAPDERSAAYIACGFAAETGNPVVLTCTGATASRNYIPGLTEAYYRKLPIIAVTSARHQGFIGQLTPQALDRTVQQNDIAVFSAQIPTVSRTEDEWYCTNKINEAILALYHHGGGPVHINIVAELNNSFEAKELPDVRKIMRYNSSSSLPQIKGNRVAVYIGNHRPFDKKTEEKIERFCELYNGVVFCDHTSNYHGKYRIQFNLISDLKKYTCAEKEMDLLVDIGEVSGAYMRLSPKVVWRVSEDGMIRDRFRIITNVFEIPEDTFFDYYINSPAIIKPINEYYKACEELYKKALSQITELPFSNIWIAHTLHSKLPDNCIIHFGILNSLRSWNFFEVSPTINCYANTGGFGIDGPISTMIGASLASPERIIFGFVGDLAFFYDLNCLGNRHVNNNIRILLVNNGLGTEFKNYSHIAHRFGDDTNEFIAAAGHYGNKSKVLVKHYAEDLGFEYITAATKEEFCDKIQHFCSPNMLDKPIIFEVFTSDSDESDALHIMNYLLEDPVTVKDVAKKVVKTIIGNDRVEKLKRG